jgi:PKD repeat protein
MEPDAWYDFRLELKHTGGARYLYRPVGSTAGWTQVYDSGYSGATDMRFGATAHWAPISLDDVAFQVGGVSPACRFYGLGEHPVTLVVYDQAMNRSAQVVTSVTTLVNDPPVASLDGNRTGDEANAVEGFWRLPYSAAASSDDHGIYRIDWDWDYDPAVGFRPAGETATDLVKVFTVADAGSRTVAVRVTDHALQSAIATATLALNLGAPPVANAGPDQVAEVRYPVRFSGTQSTDNNGIASYGWDFGDGKVGWGPTPFHIYEAEGDYTVTLTVTDSVLQTATDTLQVHIVTSTPPAAEAGGPYTAAAGGPPAYFDGRASSDQADPGVAQGIVKYLWDTDTAYDSDGDDVPDNDVDLVGARPVCTYTTAGQYTVKLTVVDGAGQQASDVATVDVVEDLPPQVICVPWRGDPMLPHPTYADRPVTLKAIVRDAGPLTYQWDFGDGSPLFPDPPAAVADPYAIEATHSYSGDLGKPYTAELTVWDAAGQAGTDQYHLIIQPDSLDTRSQIAIDEGLWYLHKTQSRPAGYWPGYGGGYYSSATGSSLQAFQINGSRLDDDSTENPYVETVSRGFVALFNSLRVWGLDWQSRGNPDTNGNGIGIDANSDRPIYETGMVMDAVASSQNPLNLAISGPDGVNGRLFYDLLTDMVDMYAWGQADTWAWGRGGWRYWWNSGEADNSA